MTTRYLALLRGVNVAGRNKLGMAALRTLAAGLGHTNVRTYLQSGNLVFDSARDGGPVVAGDLERAIADELGLAVTVLVRGLPDLERVLAADPYGDRETDQTRRLVTFLAHEPDPARVAAMVVPAGETADYTVLGRELYLHCPDGYGRTRLTNAHVEKKLGVPATTRNWRSVAALHGYLAG